jgi:uncharacterized membrane protein
MLLISIQYLPIDFEAAFLQTKQDEIAHLSYQIAFFTHVYTSFFVLVLGGVQFSKRLRTLYPKTHRAVGKLYLGILFFFSAPSGLYMGYHANGGLTAQISFCILGLLWIFFSYKALVFAKNGNWIQHRNFMYRSYALTLSAISLRLFKWLIAVCFGLPPMSTYQIVAWMGWLVNLLIAELLIIYLAGNKNK